MSIKTFNSFQILKSIFIIFSFLFLTNKVSASENSGMINDIHSQCRFALEWYDDHPGYRGEFGRVLDYCRTYAKDASPKGYMANPILSDFGSMSGVNTRPRDTIHQGIDIIGEKNNPVIAIKDGVVLETTIEACWGSTVVIDHGKSLDGKNLITIYGHVGEFLVQEGDKVKRGQKVAKLPTKINYRCMARVRHLHLQIGQRYCKKEEKDNWACKYFIKDFYRSLNPHDYWADGPGNISCFDEEKTFKKGTITYPLPCKKKIN
tara:strand:- start:14713 stop:15498 length:786 start_codon:yes stop_codon:yes gene_type:complete